MVVNENFSSTKKLVCSKWCYRQAFFYEKSTKTWTLFLQSSEKQDVLQADELQADILLSVNRSPMANDLTNTRLYTDVCSIIEQGRKEAYASVNHKMIETYWNIGRRIVEEEQNGEHVQSMGLRSLRNYLSNWHINMVKDLAKEIWFISANSTWQSVIYEFCNHDCKILLGHI